MEASAHDGKDDVDSVTLPDARLAAGHHESQDEVASIQTNNDDDDWRKEFDKIHITENKLWKRDRLVRQQEKRCISNYLRSINYDVAFVRKFCAQQAYVAVALPCL